MDRGLAAYQPNPASFTVLNLSVPDIAEAVDELKTRGISPSSATRSTNRTRVASSTARPLDRLVQRPSRQRPLRSPNARDQLTIGCTGGGAAHLSTTQASRRDAQHTWLVMARDAEPSLCMEDPLLDQDRYVYIEADAAALFPIARGARSWTDAIADGSVQVYGHPELIAALPSWFLPTEAPMPAPTTAGAQAVAVA